MNYRPNVLKRRLLVLMTAMILLVCLGLFTVDKLSGTPLPFKYAVDKGKDPIKYCVVQIFDTIPFTGQVPPDVGGRYITGASTQVDINCFAWWEFIALNWCREENGFFGKPYDTLYPVQWETFITKDQLFPAGGSAPPSWNTLTAARQSIKLGGKNILTSTKVLSAGSKFSREFRSRFDSTIIDSSGSDQAAPSKGPNWRGAQNSTNVWYEVRLNKDLYNYVVQNKFYNADSQMAYVSRGTRMSLPFGKANTDTIGAIELKASWMEVNNIKDPKWKRYKLTKAIVQDLNTGLYRNTILALVGLHIFHKTKSQQSWVWATFEQVDNVPDPANPCDTCTYNFNNPHCKNCPVNQPPSYYLVPGGKGPVPIQVSRVNALDQNAVLVNTTVQQCIAQYFPGSVWQYYQLVNVIWSGLGQTAQTGMFVPLNTGILNFPGTTVANTASETYVQSNTCFSCHAYATIAASDSIASDFSFAMGAATSPPILKMKKMRMAKLKGR